MAENKIISYDVELLSTNKRRDFYIPEIYTNDLYTNEFQFNIIDMTASELSGATATVLLDMKDGSFFNNADVTRSGNTFKYVLKENEGNHFGVAEVQLVVKISGKDYATPLYKFAVMQGLDDRKANEVVINDLNSETRREIAKLKNETNTVITDLSTQWQQVIDETTDKDFGSAPEIKAARKGELNLNARLQKENNRVTKDINLIKESGTMRPLRILEPVLTIIDDDGQMAVYNQYFPSLKTHQYPLTVALVTSRITPDRTDFMNIEHIKEMAESGLVEFVSHTVTHQPTENLSMAQWESELKDSQDFLREHNFNYHGLVYPGGYSTEEHRRIVSKYYNYAFDIDRGSRVNQPPLNTLNLQRVYIDKGVANAKSKIDKIIAEGGWMVLGSHAYRPDFNIKDVEEVVAYARSRGVAIKNVEDALQHYGNILEVGDGSNNLEKGMVIDANGKASGSGFPYRVMTEDYHANESASRFSYPQITVKWYNDALALASGMPRGKAGRLEVDRTSLNTQFINQTYSFYKTNEVLQRYWNPAKNAWDDWQPLTSETESSHIKIEPRDAFNNETDVNQMAIGFIHYCVISTNVSGFPDSRGGMLTVNRLLGNNFTFRTYEVTKSDNIYRSWWDVNANAWSAWKRIQILNP